MTPLDSLFARLDDDQKRVAAWRPADGNLRVVAAAGSGKTTTVTALVGALIRDGVPAKRIVVTTFTAKAGRELKNRIRPIVSPQAFADLRIGTFHSLALRAVRHTDAPSWETRHCIDLPGKDRGPNTPSVSVLWRTIVQYGTVPGTGVGSLKLPNCDPPSYARGVDLFRAANVDDPTPLTTRQLHQRGVRLAEFKKAWGMFNDAKRKLGVWDFADVLSLVRLSLRNGAIPADADVVIVDEAQDNTQTQIDIAQGMAGANGRVILVGDARQTVHVWRGAYPELFLNADTALAAKTLPLNTNYRSTPSIVELSNAISGNYAWSLGTQAAASRTGATGPSVKGNLNDEEDEAEWVAGRIATGLAKGAKGGDYAILTRTNAALLDFQASLAARDIPNVVVGEASLFTTREAMDVMAYCVLAYHDALPSFEQIFNRPNRFLGKDFIEAVRQQLPLCRGDLVRAVAHAGYGVKQGQKRGVDELAAAIRTLRNAGSWLATVDAVELMLVTAAADRRNKPKDQLLVPDEDAPGIYKGVCRAARRFGDVVSFIDFVEKCADSKKIGADDDLPDDKVTLSTIHRAKGLEWDHVFVQATEGVLPHKRSAPPTLTTVTGAEIEGEVRLFYVAATRARDNLTFTWRGTFDPEKQTGGPSRFLKHFGLLSATPSPVAPEVAAK